VTAPAWRYDAGHNAPAASPRIVGMGGHVMHDTLGALDVRGLEPPQPMVRILERVASLEPGETLTVIHDRRPLFLYPQLERRGLTHETDEPAAGVVRIRIRRAT
jgi:tRNA 2-thiouridine synthesizing protein A